MCYTWRNKITWRKLRNPTNCEKQMTLFTDFATNQEAPKQVNLLGLCNHIPHLDFISPNSQRQQTEGIFDWSPEQEQVLKDPLETSLYGQLA